MQSNYDVTKRRMQEEFLHYSQEEMIRRFGLAYDGRFLSFSFLGEDCRIGRESGLVEIRDFETGVFREAGYNEAMTVYDMLCCSDKGARPAGTYVGISGLTKLHSFSSGAAISGFFARDAAAFDKNPGKLAEVIAEMGGRPVKGGDFSAELPLFDGMCALFRFWRSDEEFDAAIQFLWDANILSYMHYETVWYVGAALMDRIRRRMEIPRVSLRPFREEDAGSLHKILSDPETMRWIEAPYTLSATKELIREAGLCKPPRILAAEWRKTGELIGQVIFHPYEGLDREIGWILKKEYRGRGVASELTEKLIRTAREQGVERCVIECAAGQKITEHIAEKYGFRFKEEKNGVRIYTKRI